MRPVRPSGVAHAALGALACAFVATLVATVACGRREATARSATQPPDIVLVTVDTLRWDAPGFAGQAKAATTPRLDRFAAEGRVFTNAQAHNVVTLPSHANILTGLYPYQHGIRDNNGFHLQPEIPTLATALRAAGYRTGAFVSGFPLDSRYGLDAGFATYDDRFSSSVRDTEFQLDERRGDETVAAALAWWRESAASPRLLWLHLYDPHAPYEPPEPFATQFRGQPYLGEVSAVDAYLAPLLDELAASTARPAFAVFTSDHGESLGEHGESTHGLFCYRSTLQVPLVLWGAGVQPGRDEQLARHVDLFPTLLAAAGVAPPPDLPDRPRPGRSLLAGAGRAAPASRSYFEALSTALNRGWAPLRGVIADSHKAIALPLPELYDLERDPAESRNLVDAERRRYRSLADELPRESSWPPPRETISDEEARRLAALGYLSSTATAKLEFTADDDPKRLIDLDHKILLVIEAYSRGRHPEAVRLAFEVVAERPAMPLGRSLLAQALLEAGRRAEALDVMTRARAEGVTTDSMLRQLALTLVEDGAVERALEVLAPLVEVGDIDAGIVRAQGLSDAGRHEEAAAELVELDRRRPEDPKILELQSLVALRRGRFDEARQAAAAAVRFAPGKAGAWNDLGVAQFQLGDVEAALASWRRAVELDPTLWDALWNLGVQSARRGQVEQARRALAAFAANAPADRYAADRAAARRMLAALPAAVR